MLSITDLQPGVTCVYNQKPFIVLESTHEKQGRGGGIQHVKMRCLTDGTVLQQNFKGNDKLAEAEVNRTQAQFLYKDDAAAYFMDQTNFEQFSLVKILCSKAIDYLPEGIIVDLLIYNEKPVSVNPPIKVVVKVAHADPGIKGDRASAGTKSVMLESGATIQAPLFIKTGDSIVVDTRTGTYVERAK